MTPKQPLLGKAPSVRIDNKLPGRRSAQPQEGIVPAFQFERGRGLSAYARMPSILWRERSTAHFARLDAAPSISLNAGVRSKLAKIRHMKTLQDRTHRGNSSSTAWWNDVPRGTMDEVSSHVRLDLPFV